MTPEDDSGPISNRELMREMMRRSDELSQRLARMDAETQDYRKRHHDQIDVLNVNLGRIAVDMARDLASHETRLDQHDDDLADLKTDMKGVRRDAALVSGGIGVAAFLSQYLPWGKH